MPGVEASTGSADAERPGRRDYLQNQARFAEFYRLQQAFVARLTAQPALVRTWLESLPPREEGSNEGPAASSTRSILKRISSAANS